MKTREDLIKELTEVIENLNESDAIALHNEYCEENCYYGEHIENMYTFSEYFYGMTVPEFIQNYDIEEFSFNDNYYVINDNGDITSFDYPDNYLIYSEECAEMIIIDWKYYQNNTYIDEIKYWLDVNEENLESCDI